MKSFVDGSKEWVDSLNGLHWVNPFWVESVACLHSNTAPYWLVFNPRWVLYHSLIVLASLHLKKIPPMPVALPIVASPFGLVIIQLFKAKPSPNDIIRRAKRTAIARIAGQARRSDEVVRILLPLNYLMNPMRQQCA